MKPLRLNLILAALLTTHAPILHAQSFSNASFEDSLVAANSFVFEPSGTQWTFLRGSSGDSGIANGGGAWGTGAASGQQYAFIQGNSSISQAVSNLVPGNHYQLKFAMARRNGNSGGNVFNRVEIDMDSTTLNVVYQVDEMWRTYITPVFTATSSNATFTFKGGVGNATGSTLLDVVSIVAPSAPTGILQNGGFEIANFAVGKWNYETNYLDGSGWYFSPQAGFNVGAGTSSANSPWGSAPFEGNQFAFVQRNGYINQMLQNLVVGKQYYVTFEDSFRPGFSAHTLQVLADGNLILYTLSNTATWSIRRTFPFTATTSSVLLSFSGVDAGTEASSLIDDVRVLDYTGFYSTVSGTVQIQSIVGYGGSQQITFVFRPVTGGNTITMVVAVPPSGTFSIPNIPSAKYTMHIKGDKYLAANVSIDATNGDVSNVMAFLLAGDANNDNVVDIADFGILVNAYGSNVNLPKSGYNAAADFTGDGLVDIEDFGSIVNNYNKSGAP